MTEPIDFDRFEQQMHSALDLEENTPTMLAEARQVIAQFPDAQPVGLLLSPDAVEARPMLEAIEESTGQRVVGRGLLGVMPRQMVVSLLEQTHPQILEHLPPESTGPVRKLPLIAMTRDGGRMHVVELRLGENEAGE